MSYHMEILLPFRNSLFDFFFQHTWTRTRGNILYNNNGFQLFQAIASQTLCLASSLCIFLSFSLSLCMLKWHCYKTQNLSFTFLTKKFKLLRVYWYQKCEMVLFISEKESKLPVFKSYQSTRVECIFNKTVEEILEIIDRLFTQLLCPNIKTGSI